MPTQIFRQVIRSGQLNKPVSRGQVATALRIIADQLDQPFSPQPNEGWSGGVGWEAYIYNGPEVPETLQLTIAETRL